MDFTFSEDQDALRALAARIFEDQATPERAKAIEESGEPYDRGLWQTLADANLLGLCLPEDVGGSGYGLLELGILLEEAGRRVARVPLLATLALGAAPLARFGTAETQRRWLTRVAEGRALLTAAWEEGPGADPLAPVTVATPEGSGWRLEGVKVAVPYGLEADRVVVPARLAGGGTGLFLVDPRAEGVGAAPARSTNGEPLAQLTFAGTALAAEDRLGDDDALAWAYQRATAATCALGLGVLEGGLRITAEYIAGRQQFGRPLASFQGPAMRIADAYIDTQAVEVTTWSALWRLQEGRPADDAVAIAKFWVADGGQRAVHAYQHLHGGMGVDTSYPIHRYFIWAKAIETALGAATPQLLRLGRQLAAAETEVSTDVA